MHENQENSLERKTVRDLPNEILLTIFSYLQTHDIRFNISNVCLRWSNLAKDKRLWKQLSFKTTNKSTKTFGTESWFSTLRFLEKTPELQNVVVSQGHSDDEIGEILKWMNDHSPNLRHIEFQTDLNPVLKHLRGLENILEKVESLTLSLASSCSSRSNVFKVLSEFKNLKKLVLLGSNPEPASFRNFLRDSTFLERLDLSRVELSKANFMSLCNFRHKLVALGVKTDKLDESCLKLLATFPNLKDLTLTDGNSSPEKLLRIGELSCLKRLRLQEDASSPVLTSAALTEFFHTGSFPNLRELKLHKSRLNDEGAAEIRRNCLNLIYLEVMTYPRSVSSLSEKALLHFLHCRHLEHFEILFDNSSEVDWIYRRIRYVRHDCDVDGACSIGLEALLDSWDEIQIPVD